MKTRCMSCGGTTKKMQAGGTAKKMQVGGLPKAQGGRNVINYPTRPTPLPEPSKTGGGKGPVKAIKKVLKKLTPRKTNTGCFGANCEKMQVGGSLPKAQFGGQRRARQQGSLPSRSSCGEKIKRRKKSWERQDKAGRVLKRVGAAAGVIGGIGLAGAAAYKKSTPFKNAVDELKGKLGFNQKGGIVKKYQNGGSTDSLKVIKKEGKLAVKTEKQKQAAAKKAAANAKKIAKAKENARLNLEWQKMTKDQKDSLFISERQKNW